jgi:hypothetical protein
MPTSSATIALDQPRRYMTQLCKHFDHKLPVTLEESSGSITFDAGLCTLTAEAEALVLHITSPDDETLARTQDVVARHLQRFAFRAPPEIIWHQ